MWEYMCGMTCAQIELMSIDKPLTLYGNKSKGPTAEELLDGINSTELFETLMNELQSIIYKEVENQETKDFLDKK